MQPTLPQSAGAADMDLPAVQSMDWLFKKERIYLLAQFWQQRATLAEKEVSTLKEELSVTRTINSCLPATQTAAAQQNGIPPSLASPMSDDCNNSSINNLSSKSLNNNKSDEINENKMDVADMHHQQQQQQQHHHHNHNNNSSRSTPALDKDGNGGGIDHHHQHHHHSTNNNLSSRLIGDDELAAKDKEILALVEEVTRLRSALSDLQESHNTQLQQIQLLEGRLDAKRQHISRLEARLDKQAEYDEIKKENSSHRTIDVSSDSKQFEELLLERTKALAAQTDLLKSSNIDDTASAVTAASVTPLLHSVHPLSTSSTPIHTPASTPVPSAVHNPNGNTATTTQPQQPSAPQQATQTTPSSVSSSNVVANTLLPPSLQNVEAFSSFLGEEIVSNWRRGLELPPPTAGVATLRTSMQSMQLNHQISSPTADEHLLSHRHQDDKSSSHHDASSTASTPVLQDARSEENLNGSGGGGHTPMSLKRSKSPEDNNNHLGALPHGPASFPMGLPFQFQERGHFRFADDMQMAPGTMAGRLGDSLIPKGDPMEAKLQEMLRYNMDKYANQNLDTLHISRRVRELLSVHNIGQRLFAKYVLGLSQGTVSELLSKPKPWDKLTEKGRDSYRKMHAWSCDDNAVLLLKSLIPKKGQPDSGMPSFGRSEDGIADDRIAHILSEASSMIKQEPPRHQQQHQQQQQQHHHHNIQQQLYHQQQQQQQHQQQQQQQQQQHNQQEDSHSNDDSKSPHNNQCSSPFSRDSQSRRSRKYDNDDIPQDKVSRIYQEELAKLMSLGGHQRDSFPRGGMPPTAQMPDDNIRLTIEAYHRELAKLQQSGGNIPNFPNLPGLLALQQLNGAQDLSVKKETTPTLSSVSVAGNNNGANGKMNGQPPQNMDELSKDSEDPRHSGSAFSLVRPKQEQGTTPTTTASSAAPSPLGNSILPPAMTPTDDFSSAASPLQRMASITNSLITQSPVTSHHNSPQRPLKAVLPPITQQQFDMFNNLNTEDIVRRVKEALSQYSISQRLFGESVLGLSQGSVSDLLARPKPWHMLTQKGREPFIRMKMFLEDENAVHKLVASQYKIAPEKLMRTGNYSGSAQLPPGVGKQMPPMHKMMSEMSKLQQEQHLMHMQQMQQQISAATTPQQQAMLLTPPGLPPHHRISLPSEEKKPMMAMPSHLQADDKKPAMAMPTHSPQQHQQQQAAQQQAQHQHQQQHQQHQHQQQQQQQQHQQQQNAMRGMHQHMSPTVYEMAALTQDLDTQIITTKIKEALLANNIGQKIFGEAVLGLSQGSVSELLSKPKPWHMLSIKGREPFIRMQLWLADSNNVDRLQALKNERREANKRRRSSGPGVQDNSSDTSSNDTSEFYTSNSPGPGSVGSAGAPPNKKQRVLFSEEQKEALRLAFALDPYPNVATIEFLATELGLSTRTITNWFHNHRMRLKQQVPHGGPAEPVPSRENQTGAPFDPVQFRLLLNQRLMELQKERMGLAGIPIPYPPYFAANPNLAALIGRGLFPTSEAELSALNNAFKEQMSGLDLSMGSSLKRERDDDFDEIDGDESRMSDDNGDDDDADDKSECGKDVSASLAAVQARTNRRKPVAPQWVNPVWQDDKKPAGLAGIAVPTARESEVIINGVCVMQQAADYSRSTEETVRVEPQAVPDRFDDDDEDDDDVRSHDNDRDSPLATAVPTVALGPNVAGASEKGADEQNSETNKSNAIGKDDNGHNNDNGQNNDDKPIVHIKNEAEDYEARDSERWDF